MIGKLFDLLQTFEDEPNRVLSSPEEVTNKVSEITKKVTGGKGIQDHLIVLNVYATHVTDLTIIDLPGNTSTNQQRSQQNKITIYAYSYFGVCAYTMSRNHYCTPRRRA